MKEEKKKEIEYIMGIDEAGRGPVLGPMIYGGLIWPKDFDQKLLRKIIINDSKQVSKQDREKSFAVLEDLKVK